MVDTTHTQKCSGITDNKKLLLSYGHRKAAAPPTWDGLKERAVFMEQAERIYKQGREGRLRHPLLTSKCTSKQKEKALYTS